METRKLTTTEREMLKLKINRTAEKHPEFKAKIMKLDKGKTDKEN